MMKQIFAAIILGLFYTDSSWLNELTNMDHMVEYNTINLSQVGADPNVIKNNSIWPLTPAQRTDSGIQIPLATFDTAPTHVTNVEELETSYNKCQSVVQQHINTLRQEATKSAAFNIAPASHTVNTPVLLTTGTAGKITYDDITNLSLSFNQANLPQEGRVLLLSPRHQKELKVADITLFKSLIKDGEIDGFKVYMTTATPNYTVTGNTATKGAYGSVTGLPSSVAFCKSEVMRAMGTIEGEPEKRWSDYRGWLIGFQMRFVAIPFRNKGVAAIVSAS